MFDKIFRDGDFIDQVNINKHVQELEELQNQGINLFGDIDILFVDSNT